MKALLLYKNHDNKNCETLQSVVRYLYAAKIADIIPNNIIEKNFPDGLRILPTIVLDDRITIEGLPNIINYYENLLNIQNLANKAIQFNELNPNYRIKDKSTHKKMILS